MKLLDRDEDAEIVSRPQGRIQTTVRGSHVDINVRLCRWGRLANIHLGALILLLAAIVGEAVWASFMSGRVTQLLNDAREGLEPCHLTLHGWEGNDCSSRGPVR